MRLLHFILSHSIFISFCAVALSLQTLLLLSFPINGYLLGLIFFATLAGYNAYWMVSRISFNRTGNWLNSLAKKKSSLGVFVVAVAGILACFLQLHLVWYNLLITVIFLALYAVPLLPIKQLHFTRKAGFLKTTLLALSWTMVTILVPLQVPVTGMSVAEIIVFFNRFLFMLTLCIIFDKRDAAVDKIRGLQSLATDVRPVLLSVIITLILLCYAATCIWLLYFHDTTLAHVIALLLAGLVTSWVYLRSSRETSYLFYYFVVDGLMFLSGLLSLLASI
ncbi:MAG: hypothetical protein Q7T76_09735 [Ferruginibacter sp.]|nr:hypothetical protein [Ferruginibacter sp.]